MADEDTWPTATSRSPQPSARTPRPSGHSPRSPGTRNTSQDYASASRESTEVLHRTQPKLAARLEKAVDSLDDAREGPGRLEPGVPEHGEGVSLGLSSTRMTWTYRQSRSSTGHQHHEQQDGTPRLHRGAQVHRLRGSKAACKPVRWSTPTRRSTSCDGPRKPPNLRRNVDKRAKKAALAPTETDYGYNSGTVASKLTPARLPRRRSPLAGSRPPFASTGFAPTKHVGCGGTGSYSTCCRRLIRNYVVAHFAWVDAQETIHRNKCYDVRFNV